MDGPLHRSKFSFSVLRGVNHRDIRINLHRLAIENCRSVAPLADRFPRRKIEKRIAGNNLQGLNRAVRADDGAQFYPAFSVGLPRKRRIHRLDSVNQHRRIEMRYLDDSRFCANLRWWLRRTRS